MVAQLSIEKKNKEAAKDLQKTRRVVLAELYGRTDVVARSDLTWGDDLSLSSERKSSLLQIGYGHRSDRENFMNLYYRIANNDFLDRRLHGQEKTRFTMGAIDIETDFDEFDIREITGFDVTNLNTNPLPMDITHEFSWQLKLAYQPRNAICDDKCRTASFTGKVGKSYRVNDALMLYSLWGGSANHKQADEFDYVTILGENGLLVDFDDETRFYGGADVYWNPWNGETETVLKSYLAHDLTTQNDIRFGIESNLEGDFYTTVRAGHYFD